MKRTLLVVFLFLSSFLFVQSSKADTWYSQGLPDPTDVHNWTIDRDGGFFCSNFSTPGDIFVVQAGHDVTITTSWGVTGAGAKLQVESGAVLTANGPVTIGTATTTFQIDNGGKYIHNNTAAFASTILQGAESFASNSTFEFQNWNTTPPAAGITWGTIVFNAANPSVDLQWDENLITVNGNLEVKNTGTKKVIVATLFSGDLTIGGDLIISGGTFDVENYSETYVNGNFNMSGGTLTKTDPSETSIIFNGINKTYSYTGGTISTNNMVWEIGDNASLKLLTNIIVPGGNVVSAEGTLDLASLQVTGAGGISVNTEGRVRTSHPNGLIGNLANTGSRYFSQFGIEYYGTGNQSLGLSGTNAESIRYLEITNTTGIVTADANIEIDHNSPQTIGSGVVLDMKNFTMKFFINGGINISGTIKTSNPNGFNRSLTTTISNYADPWINLAAGSTIEYYSTASRQNITPRGDYKNLTISGDSVKTFTGAVGVADTFKVSSESIVLLDTNSLAGDTAAFAGTGSISLSSLTQVTGFTNEFPGIFFIIGSNASIPAGTYNRVSIDGSANLTGNAIIENLTLFGTLNVGTYSLTLSNPIQLFPENLITDSTSTLAFSGTSPLTIPSSVTNLRSLVMNNTGGVTAVTDINVHGIFNLFDGLLHIGSHTLSADTVLGGSATNYVQTDSLGRLKINNVQGVVFFHVGNTSYNLCVLNNTGGTPDNFSVGVQNTITNPTPDNNQAVQRQWNISEDVPGGSNVFLTFQWAGAEEGSGVNHSGLAVGHFTGGTYQKIPCNPVAGTDPYFMATSSPVSSFSPFIIANDAVAPVEFASFTSVTNRNNVSLKWGTVMEENNSGFDVERKNESSEWIKVTNVQGHGTSNNPHSYSFEDRNLQTGKYNYRLKQIDYNGNFEYFNLSNEVIVGVPSKFDLSQNYPNPFNPSTSINYELPSVNFVSIKIYDLTGREVTQLVNETKEAGYYTVKFDASKLSSGMYFYNLRAGDFSATKKMMLVK